MKPDENDNFPRRERIPPDIFFEDIIEQSVRRIFEGNDTTEAIPSIKIINLSICDPAKMFFSQLSSVGKLLDWLSVKYQVLFCVSAGNIQDDFELEYTIDELKNLSELEILGSTIKCILNNIRNRRIIAPADSINALCVGALHSDYSQVPSTGCNTAGSGSSTGEKWHSSA